MSTATVRRRSRMGTEVPRFALAVRIGDRFARLHAGKRRQPDRQGFHVDFDKLIDAANRGRLVQALKLVDDDAPEAEREQLERSAAASLGTDGRDLSDLEQRMIGSYAWGACRYDRDAVAGGVWASTAWNNLAAVPLFDSPHSPAKEV